MKLTSRLTSEMVENVMVRGRAVKTDSFLFKYLITDSSANNKAAFAFIASKKNFKTAVERNRARRRGRAAIQRLMVKTLKFTPSYGAFMLNKTINTADIKDITSDIEQVLIKSGILVKQ